MMEKFGDCIDAVFEEEPFIMIFFLLLVTFLIFDD